MTRGWLLDTNVVSELIKARRANPAVIHWLDRQNEDALYLSALTLGEIAKGIELSESRGQDMHVIRRFLEHALPERFEDRILPFDARTALIWGRMLSTLKGNRDEERKLAVDAQIAATAEVASLGVCSRNLRDFRRLGVTDLFDPFAVS